MKNLQQLLSIVVVGLALTVPSPVGARAECGTACAQANCDYSECWVGGQVTCDSTCDNMCGLCDFSGECGEWQECNGVQEMACQCESLGGG